MKINGVNYRWKDKEKGEELKMGLIAQNIEKVYPELVKTGKDGFKAVEYANLVAALIEAIKEQQRIIDTQRSELLKQRRENEENK